MKALTLHRPWARYVANGEKRIENRGWAPPAKMLGETIAIHAGKFWSDSGEDYCRKTLGGLLPTGEVRPSSELLRSMDYRFHPEGIIGTAKIVGWFNFTPSDPGGMAGQNIDPTEPRIDFRIGDTLCNNQDEQWCFGPVCWVLRQARVLPKPIACRGMQKLWNIPTGILAKLDDALRTT